MIQLQQVSKTYDSGETYAVREVNLTIEEGELLILLGQSGCGKTTTLKMINRLIDISAGTIMVDDEDTRSLDPVQLRRRIGYVFQGIGLFPHLTVGENVAVVPKLLDWNKQEIAARVDELLEMVHLPAGEYRERYPQQLSGGQRQRVGLARALAARPRLMLMDEPFGALDPLTRDDLQEEFRKIHAELKLTTVMVTHDMTEALLLGDRIAVMYGGKILRVGTPHELLSDPRDDYVRQLMEKPRREADRLEAMIAEQEGK